MDVGDAGRDGPGEEPEADGESGAGCHEGGDFGFGAEGDVLLAVGCEFLLVVDAGEDVEEETEEDGEEGEGGGGGVGPAEGGVDDREAFGQAVD